MTRNGIVLTLLALTLTGCNRSTPRNSPEISPGPGSDPSPGLLAAKPPPPPSCACNEFPFPTDCATKCETGEVSIESVNTQTDTAEVKIMRGGESTNRTLPLSELPAGVPAEKGANFTALFQKNASSLQNLRVIRFTKAASSLRIPAQVH